VFFSCFLSRNSAKTAALSATPLKRDFSRSMNIFDSAERHPHNLHDMPDTTIMLPIFAAALIAIVVVSGRALCGCYHKYRLTKTAPVPRPPTESAGNMRRVESVTTCSSFACKSSQARRTHRRTASDPLSGMLTICVAMGSHPDLHGA